MGMAQVIAAHQSVFECMGSYEDDSTWLECSCRDSIDNDDDRWTGDTMAEHAAHIAAELAKAGYGNVREAKVEVLMEESRVFEAGEWCEPYARADVRDDRDAAVATAWWLRERAETLGAVT